MRSIVAVTSDYGIGLDGRLLTHISSDLKRFKEITLGGAVIYGRKTLETYPKQKALLGRVNLMLTRNRELSEPNIKTVDSLDALFVEIDALRRRGFSGDDLFVIGGAEIYEQLHPFVNEVLITRIDEQFEADRHFPNLDQDPDFVRTDVSDWYVEKGVRFRYETWRRVVDQVTLEATLKKDRLALARRNVAEFSQAGTVKKRLEILEDWVQKDGRFVYQLRSGEDVFGFLLFAPEVLGADTATVVLHSDLSLTKNALGTIFETLFAEHQALYSLLLAADERVLIDADLLPGIHTATLPGIDSTSRLIIGTRSDLARGAVGFFPFELGLVALKSDGQALTEVEFLQLGQRVEDSVFKMALKVAGALNKQNGLKKTVDTPFSSSNRPDEPLQLAFDWLTAYFEKKSELPPLPPLSDQALPPFMTKVLDALKDIPYGEHLTYSELAETLVGRKKANDYARAVGQACAANPYALFIPCHRVIGNRGELVGFSGGIQVKDYLLNLELMARLSRRPK